MNIIQRLEYANFDILGDLTSSALIQCLKRDENRRHINVMQSGMKGLYSCRRTAPFGAIAPKISSDNRLAYRKSLAHWTHKRLDEADLSDKHDSVTFTLTILPRRAKMRKAYRLPK